MTAIDYEARADAGIALIDEKFPGFLDEHLNLLRLDVQLGDRCVTAQLAQWHLDDSAANYIEGMEILGLEEDGEHGTIDGTYTDHGFNAEDYGTPGLPEDYDRTNAYDTLTDIWRRKISERRAART